MNFTSKVVLITGAGAGIGRATALKFAEAGAIVVVNSRTAGSGRETLAMLEEKGGKGAFVQGDVSVAIDAERLVQETVKRFGRVDVLVNNAGIVLPGRVDNMSEEDFEKTMSVNVKGTFLVSKYAILEMRKNGGGVIVNIGSVAALKGIVDRSAYSASKGAIVSLTRAMAADYIRENIRVNCVCPGTTETPALVEKIMSSENPEATRRLFTERQPMGRLGKDEEIAQAVLFACCDEAGFMNGSFVTIDGGMTI